MARDESRLPHYAYAAASAVRSLGCTLWQWSRREQTRVFLAALDALPVLTNRINYLPGGLDWIDLLPEMERTDGYADSFNAALAEAEVILAERKRRQRARAKRYGL